jgi:hypothetical protein
MSLRRVLCRYDGSAPIACDKKSHADFAARLVRENGRALAQHKLADGGWELSLSEGALKRRKRSRRRASSGA